VRRFFVVLLAVLLTAGSLSFAPADARTWRRSDKRCWTNPLSRRETCRSQSRSQPGPRPPEQVNPSTPPPGSLPPDLTPPGFPSPTPAPPQPLPPGAYDIGTPDLVDLWVDPASGDDTRTGATRVEALRTVAEAWRRIPQGTTLTGGFRVALTAGVYPADTMPNYWESRWGTFASPIVLQAMDGAGTARLASMNVYDTRYLYVLGVRIDSGGEPFHCELCDHLLLRDVTLAGTGDPADYSSPQETLKVNQSRHVYVETSDIGGAWDNAIDFVAVQYGHLRRNTVHRSRDWCAYSKGGSAYITVDSNTFYDCGTGGYTAGQGTGVQFTEPPWIRYEAYGIRVTNNVVHDTEGSAFGVFGGYDVLFAYNTAYRVGSRSQLVDVAHGGRSCDGAPDAAAVAACAARLGVGAWGSTDEGGDYVPNRNVWFYDNVIVNPDGFVSGWQHLLVQGCVSPPAGFAAPRPSCADDGAVFRANVIWNGTPAHPLGVDGDLAADILAHNAVNTVRPLPANPAGGDYCLTNGAELPAAVAIPPFVWDDVTPAASPSNEVTADRRGNTRGVAGAPGAC